MKPSQFFFVECDLDAYNILTTITQKAIENAGVVAETYNGLNGVLTAIKDKANAIASKIAAGGKPTASEIATLQQAAKQGIAQMQASLDAMRAGLGDKINAETAKLLQTKIDQLKANAQDIGSPATALVAAQALAKTDPVALVKEVKKLQPLAVEYNGKSFSSKGAIIKMQPGNIDGVMQSNGEIPLICGFDLKNTVEGDPITWHLETSNGTVLPLEAPLRTSASSKDTYLGIQWPDGQNSLKLSVVTGERSLHFTLLKPDWKVSGLQIADGGRVAKAGETLYLVKSPLKNEKATVSWTSNLDPLLLNNHYFVNGTKSLNNLSAHKIPYNFSSSPSKTTYRLNALGYDESVKVEVVGQSRHSAEFMPPATSALLTSTYKTIGDNTEILHRSFALFGLKKPIEIKPLKIKGEIYNEEDEKSRHFLEVIDGSITGGIEMKWETPTIYPPFLKVLNIENVIQTGLYANASLEMPVVGGINRRKIHETGVLKVNKPFYLSLQAKGCIEAGLKSVLLIAKESVDFSIKGFGKACVAGSLTMKNNDKNEGKIEIDPLVVAISAQIRSKGTFQFTLVDMEYNYALTKPYKIWDIEELLRK